MLGVRTWRGGRASRAEAVLTREARLIESRPTRSGTRLRVVALGGARGRVGLDPRAGSSRRGVGRAWPRSKRPKRAGRNEPAVRREPSFGPSESDGPPGTPRFHTPSRRNASGPEPHAAPAPPRASRGTSPTSAGRPRNRNRSPAASSCHGGAASGPAPAGFRRLHSLWGRERLHTPPALRWLHSSWGRERPHLPTLGSGRARLRAPHSLPHPSILETRPPGRDHDDTGAAKRCTSES